MRLPALTPSLKIFSRHTPQRRRKGQGARSGPVTLGRPRIFILPTRQGMLFALILFTMLLGSINYSNNLGFALTFLLAGMSFLAILHTYRNLAGLEFSAGRSAPVFAGDTALFNVIVHNPSARARYALLLALDQQPVLVPELPPQGTQSINLAHPATQRGWLAMGRLTASTRFPLGLFCAWSYLQVEARCLVYPAPRGAPALSMTAHDGTGGHSQSAGDEDFAGQRNYRAG
ncbi:MAG TPA: DUF58 domain-containing protein, partial [Gammaproteobacteria bacterium]|nr:DUF58 domain-containing protein [Gammaproteobacteria bacterium]